MFLFHLKKFSCYLEHSFETRTGSADRPGHGTGPGLSKNPPGSWPGETRSTRVNPVETRPLFYIYVCVCVCVTMSFWRFNCKMPKRLTIKTEMRIEKT